MKLVKIHKKCFDLEFSAHQNSVQGAFHLFGRYMDKINKPLLAYVLLLGCLFVEKINAACNLQLVSTLWMTGSIKCLALKY